MMTEALIELCDLFIFTILSFNLGMDVVKAVEKVGSQSGKPSKHVRIVKSGEL